MHPDSKVAVQPSREFGVRSVDLTLGGGLARGSLHEIYAAEADDFASAAGFALAMAARLTHPGQSFLWLRVAPSARSGGVIQANGWAELGGIPADAIVGVLPDGMAVLRAAVDALRCPALGAVIVESWGAMRELDLTASRRLALAAEKSGVPLLLLRIDAAPVPSAAQTRWQAKSAPSRALPGNAPGLPAFDVTLLRQRSGPCGLGWRLEWDHDQRIFREATLSGAVVPVPADRPVEAGAGRTVIPQGRYAA
jgi:protein ImuA